MNLAFNGLSTPDMGMISSILKRHRTLKEFDISGNQFTPEHGVIIAASMANNKRVRGGRVGGTVVSLFLSLHSLCTVFAQLFVCLFLSTTEFTILSRTIILQGWVSDVGCWMYVGCTSDVYPRSIFTMGLFFNERARGLGFFVGPCVNLL